MKKKLSLNKKIFLQKETIAVLSAFEQRRLQGGGRTVAQTGPTLPSPINCLCCYIPVETEDIPCNY
ncbi:class I lanthipeptide [Chitinophaga solisilvae]|uniref:Uncharacterized protein n=1 Tax=Chitinophaga solisilvae TaxID=1233460 RepID=A0A3S1DJI2_9BACT|nr:class I lanthipeptide [Chitinophaga solisilvae]NSL89810.1 hypothetical protein [Chitinophaga solisilvae]